MKFYLILLSFGLLGCQASQDIQDLFYEEADYYTQMKDLLEPFCLKHGGPGAVKNLSRTLDEAKECLTRHLPQNVDELSKIADNSLESTDICSEERDKALHCFDGFVDVWESCSPEEEKYMPTFMMASLKAMFDYICEDYTRFLFNVITSLDCLLTLSETYDESVCPKKNDMLTNFENDVITKPELCLDILSTKACFGEFISQQCPRSPDFKELFDGIMTAIHSPCTKGPRSTRYGY